MDVPFLNREKMGKKPVWLIAAVLVVLFLGYWFFIRTPALITVVGEGRVKVTPTIVKFSVTVNNISSSATLGIADNNRLMRNLISTAKANGVLDGDISSSYVRVIPPSQLTGVTAYQAVNAVTITLKDVSKFDNLVVALYNTGAQSISNIVFTVEDSRDLEKEAVADAIKDAKSRAKEIARASGKFLGKMRSVTTMEVGEAGALSGEVAQAAAGGVLSSSPSQIEIVRQASLVFELR